MVAPSARRSRRSSGASSRSSTRPSSRSSRASTSSVGRGPRPHGQERHRQEPFSQWPAEERNFGAPPRRRGDTPSALAARAGRLRVELQARLAHTPEANLRRRPSRLRPMRGQAHRTRDGHGTGLRRQDARRAPSAPRPFPAFSAGPASASRRKPAPTMGYSASARRWTPPCRQTTASKSDTRGGVFSSALTKAREPSRGARPRLHGFPPRDHRSPRAPEGRRPGVGLRLARDPRGLRRRAGDPFKK